MSKIFELFGYRLDAWNNEAAANRAKAWCPFMGAECDGGGNRYLSAINLDKVPALRPFFPKKKIVQAGVCSLRLKEGEQPWIVCPRRLLSLRHGQGPDYQTHVKRHVLRYSGLSPERKHRAWSEVKMKVATVTEDEQSKSFDYSFDYVLAGARRMPLQEVAALLNVTLRKAQSIAEKNGFTLARRENELWIDDAPADPILIVEVMTSSTSGGDKNKRTQIGMAFEDAVINGAHHQAPTINYRQVWARMVSQLIVKSQVGLAWGGKTFWLLQDVLTDYISASTALDLARYLSEHANEVNILAVGYGNVDASAETSPIIEIKDAHFFSGPIAEKGHGGKERGGFVDIVKIGAAPPKEHLWRSLLLKAPAGVLSV
ncbi:MAG TPA: hypothetical protein PLC99_14975 [Verrucomicrobiota bacterium]|nr:hypothetical protein [Verrucomicrobiota bacterium]